jgi:hypothetical protein
VDNDLMARRLRPPSEPVRPQNGHSPLGFDDAPWAPNYDLRSDVPWDRPEDEPWPPAAHEWSEVNEPDAENTWSPVSAAPAPTAPDAATFDAAAAAQPNTTPGNVAAAPEAAPSAPPVEAAVALPEQLPNRPTTWDDMPAPWDVPADEPPQMVQEAAEVVSMPDVVSEPGDADQLMDEYVPGRAPWDEPEPFAMGDSADDPWADDDRPPEMFRDHGSDLFGDDWSRTPAATSPNESTSITEMATVVAATAVDDGPAPWEVSGDSIDPDDALAPVLSDVEQPVPPPWAAWAHEPVASATATLVAPPDVAAAHGPTPPDELFAEFEVAAEAEAEAGGEPAAEDDLSADGEVEAEWGGELAVENVFFAEQEIAAESDLFAEAEVAPEDGGDVAAEVEAEAEGDVEPEAQADLMGAAADPAEPDPGKSVAPAAVADVAVPFSKTPTGQPLIVRIEVAIVDGSAVVRPIQDAWQAPRNQLNGAGAAMAAIPDEAPPAASWLPPIEDGQSAEPVVETAVEPHSESQAEYAWTLPTASGDGEGPSGPAMPAQDAAGDPWATADPMATWALEPADVSDPLADLPAASVADDLAVAAVPAAAASAPTPAPAAAPTPAPAAAPTPAPDAQQDLWFLSSEPETMAVDPGAPEAREPSNALTAGLTVLMAVVVIGLVIAFLWLMTSLPILR